MKKLLLILLLVLSFPLVMASTPNYDVTAILEDEVINGFQNLGTFLFIEKPYTPEIHSMNSITSATYQQWDVLRWDSTNSVIISDPDSIDTFLFFNSEYQFTKSGIYTLKSPINTTIAASLILQPQDEIFVNLSQIGEINGMDFDFDEVNFFFDVEKSINVDIDVDKDVDPDDFVFNYAIGNSSYSHDFEVIDNVEWSMDISDLQTNISLKNGDTIYLGRIELQNEGNTDVEIFVNKDSENGYLIGTPAPQTLFKNSELFINLQTQIPQSLVPGEYDIELVLSGGDVERNINFTFFITDNIAPVIESINFSTERVLVDNEIFVVATDNNLVENVTLSYDGKVVVFDRDGNLFSKIVKFDKISSYILDFCAEDQFSNVKCMSMNKSFVRLDIISGKKNFIQMPSVKQGTYANEALFVLDQRVPEGVNIQLLNVQAKNQLNITPFVRIVNEQGSISQFNAITNEVTIYDAGQYRLEVRYDGVEDFDGVLRVETPDYVDQVQDITFKVSFKNYEVPTDFSVDLPSGEVFNCVVSDTGNFDTSFRKCSVDYPLDVSREDVVIPMTIQQRDDLQESADVVQRELEDYKDKSILFITLISTGVVFLVIYLLYLILIYPFSRIRMKVK